MYKIFKQKDATETTFQIFITDENDNTLYLYTIEFENDVWKNVQEVASINELPYTTKAKAIKLILNCYAN